MCRGELFEKEPFFGNVFAGFGAPTKTGHGEPAPTAAKTNYTLFNKQSCSNKTNNNQLDMPDL